MTTKSSETGSGKTIKAFNHNAETLKITKEFNPLAMPIFKEDDSSLIDRFRFYLSLPDDCDIERLPSVVLDLDVLANRFPIPSSRLFSQLKYTKQPSQAMKSEGFSYQNVASQQYSTMFSCDHTGCGKFFKKI